MPVLTDHRKEKFSQLVANGTNPLDAYEIIGFSRSINNCRKFKALEDVSERIEELRRKRAEKVQDSINEYVEHAGITPAFLLRELLETAKEARDNGKYDSSVKVYMEIGRELFSMFKTDKEKKAESEQQAIGQNITNNVAISAHGTGELKQAIDMLGDLSKTIESSAQSVVGQ